MFQSDVQAFPCISFSRTCARHRELPKQPQGAVAALPLSRTPQSLCWPGSAHGFLSTLPAGLLTVWALLLGENGHFGAAHPLPRANAKCWAPPFPQQPHSASSWCYCKVSVLTLHVYLWGGSWLLWGFLVRLQIFKVMLRKENVNCKKLNTVPVLVLIKKVKNLH